MPQMPLVIILEKEQELILLDVILKKYLADYRRYVNVRSGK